MSPSASVRTGAIVLAAGRSKRFRSSTPKVLHPLLGRTLAEHVLQALRGMPRSVRPSEVVVVTPPGGEVEAALGAGDYPFALRFAVQREPKGTGDAARIGLSRLSKPQEVLVLAGDAPLLQPATLAELARARRARRAACGVLTAILDDPGAYGRVVRAPDGRIDRIVEAPDASSAERAIAEINTSTYVFDAAALARALPKLRTDNAQDEFYLTDAVRLLVNDGVVAVTGDPGDALGANTRGDFALVSRVMRARIVEDLLDRGVTVADPDTCYVDAGVTVGAETVLLPNTHLEGSTRIGGGCEIGPSVRLVDTAVGAGATVTFAVARSARIGPGAQVGPFASLRAGTVLGRNAKIGTFVETKAAVVGEGAKVPHLAYMGDVTIGRRSNIGAGTITCNYDGTDKHRTEIGDDAFVGTNNSLRAPVRIGTGAYTGAGSVVTRDVAPGEMVFGVPARPAPQDPKRRARAGTGRRTRRGRETKA